MAGKKALYDQFKQIEADAKAGISYRGVFKQKETRRGAESAKKRQKESEAQTNKKETPLEEEGKKFVWLYYNTESRQWIQIPWSANIEADFAKELGMSIHRDYRIIFSEMKMIFAPTGIARDVLRINAPRWPQDEVAIDFKFTPIVNKFGWLMYHKIWAQGRDSEDIQRVYESGEKTYPIGSECTLTFETMLQTQPRSSRVYRYVKIPIPQTGKEEKKETSAAEQTIAVSELVTTAE